MRWRCQYHNSNGVRCIAPAVYRYLFHNEHPFDYTDRCREHAPEFSKGRLFLDQQGGPQYAHPDGRQVSDSN
jgi:hypothetical protein